jgi:hypothetical protein
MSDNPTVNLAARSLIMLQRHTEPKPAARPHGPSILSCCHAVVLHGGFLFLRAVSEPGLTVEQDCLYASPHERLGRRWSGFPDMIDDQHSILNIASVAFPWRECQPLVLMGHP